MKMSDPIKQLKDQRDIELIIQGAVNDLMKTHPGISQSVMIHKPFITRVADPYGQTYVLIDYEAKPVYERYAFERKSLELYQKFCDCRPGGSC